MTKYLFIKYLAYQWFNSYIVFSGVPRMVSFSEESDVYTIEGSILMQIE